MDSSMLSNYVNKIKVPTNLDKVYKEECVFCFNTPESPGGLYVCMCTFLGFCHTHLTSNYWKTRRETYLCIKRKKTEIKKDDATEEKPTKLAIGVEGGFMVDAKKYEYEDTYSIVILPDFHEFPVPLTDMPPLMQMSVTNIVASDDASKAAEAKALVGTWDGMKREVTKHANTLVQLNNGVKIPPKGWKCEDCGLAENLWLNLTDGTIRCGRRYFNGQGGNNHSLEHYNRTKYPLVVKLGTITSEAADVYSYDEDNMVEDPNLPAHLAHFGININQLEKTDKSMIELEIDMNQRIGEWAIIQESGSQLVPIYGPGFTGMENLGNSCYLNSVMQVLFTIPDFQQKYFANAESIIQTAPDDPTNDFNVQMCKLAHGLLSGDYSVQPKETDGKQTTEDQQGIRPQMFKCLIGEGHPEFSTKRQQDAQEFFLYLITLIERHSRGQTNPADALKFQVEERIQCAKSGKVKYDTRADYLLSLPIPMEAITNMDEVAEFEKLKEAKAAKGERIDGSETVRPKIPLSACLESFSAEEEIEDFYSTAINAQSVAKKKIRMFTFPDYLMLHMKKFTIGDDWVPKKLDVSIDVPDKIDLAYLRGTGKKPDEEELPEQVTEFAYDEPMMMSLAEMGFPVEACKRALYHTQNGGLEAAMSWLLEHVNDPDYSSPFNVSASSKTTDVKVDESAIQQIVAMGFTSSQATKALQATDNNLERALDWIFSHAEELDSAEAMDCSESPAKYRDGSENYELVAFISHMGTSTVTGHYVCHIKKEGRWVIYNDNKVALSEHPPKDLAYMYLYKRISSS